MSSGSAAEWFGAIATTTAAVAALYLGLRDHRRTERRQASRQELHDAAGEMLLKIQRIQAGRASENREPKRGHPQDDVEASRLLAAVAGVGRCRQRRAIRVLRQIYSHRTLEHAYLDRDHEDTSRSWLTAITIDSLDTTEAPDHRQRALRHQAVIGRGDPDKLRQLERLLRRLTKI